MRIVFNWYRHDRLNGYFPRKIARSICNLHLTILVKILKTLSQNVHSFEMKRKALPAVVPIRLLKGLTLPWCGGAVLKPGSAPLGMQFHSELRKERK